MTPYLDDRGPADAAFVLALRDRIENILDDVMRADLREAGSDAVYVILTSETPVEWTPNAWGAASPHLADTLRESIGRRWRGPGPAVLINDLSIASTRPEAGDFGCAFVAITCHEASHVIDQRWTAPPPSNAPAVPAADIAAALAGQVQFDPAAVPPWTSHGPSFIRIAEHIRHRVELAWGFRVPLSLLWSAAALQLSRPEHYAHALGDEPERLAHLPLNEVARAPPPPALIALWRGDVTQWAKDRFADSRLPVPCSKGTPPMFTKILEKLRDRQARDATKATSAFMQLAVSIVDGKPPAEERIEAVLAACGKSLDDLQAACDALAKRRELAAKVDAGRKAEARRTEIQASLERIAREREAADRRFDAEELPIVAELDRVKAAIAAADDAARELARSAGTLLPDAAAPIRESAAESRRDYEREAAERKREIEGAEQRLLSLDGQRTFAARNGWPTDNLDADIAKQSERVDGLRDALRKCIEEGAERLEAEDCEVADKLLDVVLV